MIRPFPSGLELVPSYGASAYVDDLNPAFVEGPGVIWRFQALLLDVRHGNLLGMRSSTDLTLTHTDELGVAWCCRRQGASANQPQCLSWARALSDARNSSL